MTPTPWPVGRIPTSGRPSTIDARVSIGAFAAIAICPHVRPCALRIASPSRSRLSIEVPVMERKRHACASERSRAMSTPLCSRPSTTPVRITRCGCPSTLRVTTVPFTSVFRYTLFTASGTVLSLVIRNRVPMAMPLAP